MDEAVKISQYFQEATQQLDKLKHEVNEIAANKYLVCELQFKAVTPVRVGIYKASPIDLQVVGSQNNPYYEQYFGKSLKGLLRYAFRHILLGALIHSGIDLSPENKDLKQIRELVKQVVQYYLGSTKSSSIYKIECTALVKDIEHTALVKDLEKVKTKIPRIRLSTINVKKDIERSEKGSVVQPDHIVLRLVRRPGVEEFAKKEGINLTLSDKLMFYLALLVPILYGFGSGARRGFASFTIDAQGVHKAPSEIINDATQLAQVISSFNETAVENILTKILNNSLHLARQILIEFLNKSREGSSIKLHDFNPNIEITKSPQYFALTITSSITRFKVLSIENINKIENLLLKIGKATMKVRWKEIEGECKRKNRGIICNPDRKWHTWILGLPRAQRDTGYSPGLNLRRPSPIFVRVLNFDRNKGKALTLIWGSLSTDWQLDDLVWVSMHEGKRVDKELRRIEFALEPKIGNREIVIEVNKGRMTDSVKLCVKAYINKGSEQEAVQKIFDQCKTINERKELIKTGITLKDITNVNEMRLEISGNVQAYYRSIEIQRTYTFIYVQKLPVKVYGQKLIEPSKRDEFIRICFNSAFEYVMTALKMKENNEESRS